MMTLQILPSNVRWFRFAFCFVLFIFCPLVTMMKQNAKEVSHATYISHSVRLIHVMSDVAPSQDVFHNMGTGVGPWEIHRPQSAIVQLVEQGIFKGNILDIGCSIGDNAVYIAQKCPDVHVLAIDMVSKALEVAREKATASSLSNINFAVANILEPTSIDTLVNQQFDVVLDSAIFHIFTDEDRLRYVKRLYNLVKVDGLYVQLVFSEKEVRKGGPRRVKLTDIQELFTEKNGWRMESHEDAAYEMKETGPLGASGRAYLTLIRRISS